MKFTKCEEVEYEDLPAEKQRAVIKDQLVEFAGRVVVAIGLALTGVWYGSNTQPHTFVGSTGQTVQVTTPNIVLFTFVLIGLGVWAGWSAYKRRQLILDFVSAIQGDNARDEE